MKPTVSSFLLYGEKLESYNQKMWNMKYNTHLYYIATCKTQ